MKLSRLGIVLLVGALPVSGCVTEGVSSRQPASDEEQVEVNLALGVGYIDQGRPDLAIDALQRAIDVEPRSADAHSTIAVAYDLEGVVEAAEEHHRRAAELAPQVADIHHRYAVFLCRQGRWQDAEGSYQRAIGASARTDRIPVMLNAARCARGAGDLGGVERNFRAVLDIDAVNIEALRGMMDVSIRTGQFRNGRGFWQRLESTVQVQPDDLLSCYTIERELGDSAAAQACADRLRREFPGSPALTRLRELEQNAG